MTRGTVVAAVVCVAAATLTGCGAEKSDGPRRQLCGMWIGRAATLTGSGPFFTDATSGPDPDLHAAAGSNPMWVQVSDTCAQGALVKVSDPSIIAVSDTLLPPNTRDTTRPVAVAVTPKAVGHATLVAIMPGQAPQTVSFTIGPAPTH